MGFIAVAHAAENTASEGAALPIHLSPEILGHFFGLPITNTLLTAWLAMAIVIILVIILRSKLALRPGRFQLIVEELIGFSFNYIAEVLESKKLARQYFPLIMTIFIFILAINWVAQVPGLEAITFTTVVEHGSESAKDTITLFHPAAADLNITLAFALIAFFAIEIAGVVTIGFFKYFRKFFNFSSPLAFAIGIIEFISELARLISFSFRLFGNIFAGKTLILVVLFFLPYFLPVPLMAFEIFVGFIQAFIFAILTLFFIKLAVEEPH
ncbi:F0F1 ATP synthase subunit A [Candidatus Parcubacteria bacterium]|uniref:ATP synthase subunit a n=1 Tax=Candidatus Kaiserbacteria bacterium CG10_big_fil_rev_8_21_14_0_10_47_16 TaxID=1974608 RepID=A0A2H0UF91_9BACT|nr:F0F1 ATP synthase subunit A [Candidatus Parcubacteria bacterium]PIR84455.1 MAG: ATP synthase F0 subunit A [Candidatus Kaiserbacteria bacterium CG10_big_fil_rev_8_21_14_0_10_47_16]